MKQISRPATRRTLPGSRAAAPPKPRQWMADPPPRTRPRPPPDDGHSNITSGISEMRTGYCGDLRSSAVDQEVTLCGWVDRRRDHGGVIFIDLRDRQGIVQIVFDSDCGDFFEVADRVRREYVLQIRGVVRARSPNTGNPETPTGEIEVDGREVVVPNPAAALPSHLDGHRQVGEARR